MLFAPRHQWKHDKAPMTLNRSNNQHKLYPEPNLGMIVNNEQEIREYWDGSLSV